MPLYYIGNSDKELPCNGIIRCCWGSWKQCLCLCNERNKFLRRPPDRKGFRLYVCKNGNADYWVFISDVGKLRCMFGVIIGQFVKVCEIDVGDKLAWIIPVKKKRSHEDRIWEFKSQKRIRAKSNPDYVYNSNKPKHS